MLDDFEKLFFFIPYFKSSFISEELNFLKIIIGEGKIGKVE